VRDDGGREQETLYYSIVHTLVYIDNNDIVVTSDDVTRSSHVLAHGSCAVDDITYESSLTYQGTYVGPISHRTIVTPDRRCTGAGPAISANAGYARITFRFNTPPC